MPVTDWNAHLVELAMLKDTRYRLDRIVDELLSHGHCFAIESNVPAKADEEGQWYIWTTHAGAERLRLLGWDPPVSIQFDAPPADHGSDRYDYVELQGAPEGVEPSGSWWEQVLEQPCADCRANLFARYLGGDPSRRESWALTVAHDDACPRLEAEER